jgi:hypothetical protein
LFLNTIKLLFSFRLHSIAYYKKIVLMGVALERGILPHMALAFIHRSLFPVAPLGGIRKQGLFSI